MQFILKLMLIAAIFSSNIIYGSEDNGAEISLETLDIQPEISRLSQISPTIIQLRLGLMATAIVTAQILPPAVSQGLVYLVNGTLIWLHAEGARLSLKQAKFATKNIISSLFSPIYSKDQKIKCIHHYIRFYRSLALQSVCIGLSFIPCLNIYCDDRYYLVHISCIVRTQ